MENCFTPNRPQTPNCNEGQEVCMETGKEGMGSVSKNGVAAAEWQAAQFVKV